jgi:hypothetical protein
MLSLRMIIVAGLAGIAFWGLFQLLGNLQEPGLLRTAKAVAVKGCGSVDEHKDAARLCPQFLCQKALIDRKLASLDSRFDMVQDDGPHPQSVVRGTIVGTGQSFECSLAELKVTDAKIIERPAR